MTDEERKFFAAVGLRGVDRAAAMQRALAARFGAEEVGRIDAALETPEQFLRLEALFYETPEPSLAQARAALSGAYTPREVPPIQQVPGAAQIKPAPLAPPPQPSAPPGATGRAADPAWRAQREAELRALMRDPRYFRDHNKAVIAEVQSGFAELYPGTVDATGWRSP